jgi:peptide/nickel transport system substrate-binding protein
MRSTGGIAFALAMAAVACGPEARNSLTVAVRGDVTGIFPNPPMQTESHTFDVNSNVFEGLVRFDRNLTPEPALADRWENPDEETWIFHLRPGVRFSDGSLLTARDVAASLSAAIERRYPTSVFLHAVESVRAIGTSWCAGSSTQQRSPPLSW